MLSWILYALLATTLVAVGSVFVAIRRYRAVPMPSPEAVRRAVVRELAGYPEFRRVVDLGSGWGGMAVHIARACPQREVEGVEASPVPHLFARGLQLIRGGPENLSFSRRDLRSLTLQPDTIYVCYLSPGVMRDIRAQFESQAPPGTIVISALFGIRGWQPVRSATAGDLHRTAIFVYEP